jgi:hypothetical protein
MPISLSSISTRAPEDLDKQTTKEKLIQILPQLDSFKTFYSPQPATPS